jgi:tRNA(His) 5'-end guanylyltransferase
MSNLAIGDRMKAYENCYRNYLPNGFDVIIRVDGRAFHTFTKGFYKPFDTVFMKSMKDTAAVLCKEIQGVKFAYVQSDEISLWLNYDYENGEQPWFGNNIQKMASVSASIATLAFNRAFINNVAEKMHETANDDETGWDMIETYDKATDSATFDSRVFILPREEVANYFLWRVRDCERNSIQMVARSLYSHKELVGKKAPDLHELIHQKGQNWNNYPGDMKHGTIVVKHIHSIGDAWRSKWGPMGDEMFPDSNYESWNTFVNRFVEKT